MNSPIYIIVLFILIFLFAWILMRFLFYPILFKPRLKTLDTFKFLENRNCVLIAYIELTKNEKIELRTKSSREITLFEKLISPQTEYKVIAYSTLEKKHKIFWIEIFQNYIPHYFGKRHLNFIEEQDSNILNELTEKYDNNVSMIKDECPACNNLIEKEELECNKCGLALK